MPNTSNIIAIAADTPYAAITYDKTIWNIVDTGTARWKSIGSGNGHFIYSQVDSSNKLCQVGYATDGTTWEASVLPSPSMPCFVAIAPDLDGVATSFDGLGFSMPTPYFPQVKEIHCMATAKSKGYYKSQPVVRLILTAFSSATVSLKKKITHTIERSALATSVVSFIKEFIW